MYRHSHRIWIRRAGRARRPEEFFPDVLRHALRVEYAARGLFWDDKRDGEKNPTFARRCILR
jgi:hypothetical protein